MPLQKILKEQFLINPVKQRVLYPSLLPAAIALLTGSVALLQVDIGFVYYATKALQLALFFALGKIYISPRYKTFKFFPVKNSGNSVLLAALLLCAVLSALYLAFKKEVWLMAFSSAAAFLLPFYLQSSWEFFISIPRKKFNTWFPQTMAPGKVQVSLDSLLVRLKLTQHVNDVDEKTYTVFIPNNTRLGDFFSRFLAGHSTHIASLIEDSDDKKNKYAWEFIVTNLFGLHVRKIDPALTMAENKIRKDSVVRVKRLRQTKSSSHNKIMFNETIE